MLSSDILAPIAEGVWRRLRIDDRRNDRTATPRRSFSVPCNRILIVNYLVPMLDLAGFEQVGGPLTRLYTVARPAAVYSAIVYSTRRRTDYEFRCDDIEKLVLLFHPSFMLIPKNYLRRVFYFAGLDPRDMPMDILRALAEVELGASCRRADGTWRTKEELCCLMDQEHSSSVETPKFSDYSVSGIVCLLLREQANYFTIKMSAAGLKSAIEISFHVYGIRRANPVSQSFRSMHIGLAG